MRISECGLKKRPRLLFQSEIRRSEIVMTISEFINKWRKNTRTERSASHEHFLDLCEVFEHPKPAELDPTGESFTFERGAAKHGAGRGWADVWKRDFFGWEYKGKHKDLGAAYDQLLKYREALENPPLLVVSDMERIIIHTNFTATVNKMYEISLEELNEAHNLEVMRALFHDPERLRPNLTSASITTEVAERLALVAQGLRRRGLDPTAVARFLDRIVFCLFAEDVGLLPKKLFSQIVEKARDPEHFGKLIGQLFDAMQWGGDFGLETIRHFNGNLFTESPVLPLTAEEIRHVQEAARLDWGAVDPSIFGTLFERGLDPAKRSQLGAQYTSREDIETLIEPVVMRPLREEWDAIRRSVLLLKATGLPHPSARIKAIKLLSERDQKRALAEARTLVRNFLEHLSQVKVLDPACGSGNFLYVTLQKLKDLEKEVLIYAGDEGLGSFIPLVGPWQFYGIEINPYAFDLAQTTLWIGYLQWIQSNGYGTPAEPILRRMDNFQNKDAVLDLTDPAQPREPDWPAVDFIIGNPPFLGGSRVWEELGREYQQNLWQVYRDRVPGAADLVCYWFEKARQHITEGKCKRVGLLATQAIRGGVNREVLKRIKESGNIFFAESDRDWILDGAHVHISMIGFDDGSEHHKQLDGKIVTSINANLSSTADTTQAQRLQDNLQISYIGTKKAGTFNIPEKQALEWLYSPNPNSKPNSDVLKPWLNGEAIVKRPAPFWIIDCGSNMSLEDFCLYEHPFSYVEKVIKPEREKNKRELYRKKWWLHAETRPGMREAIKGLPRYLATTGVSKYRIFIWVSDYVLCDGAVFVFARSDDYFFGLLHSRLHEVWARAQGTQVRERESGFRYTPTTCFETFPFPDAAPEQREAIAEAARELDRLRSAWLNPPEWTRLETLRFPGSTNGPWARYVQDANERGLGTVHYSRLVARDDESSRQLARRTLTNLYNQRPTWLALAHRKLDEAVCASYGWPPSITDADILARLLELNLRAPVNRGSGCRVDLKK
jgi:type II restriction/modification system DNA methylase subunit YeeA